MKSEVSKKTNIKKEIKKTITELLGKLLIEAKTEVVKESKDKPEQTDHFKVSIQTQDTGLLIGFHGETINSLQLLLGIILYKKLGAWQRVVLDVGDYREKRKESIKEMVARIIAEVESTNTPVTLPYLTPLERRFVHMLLSTDEKVTTESVGEGKDRRLTIKPLPPAQANSD